MAVLVVPLGSLILRVVSDTNTNTRLLLLLFSECACPAIPIFVFVLDIGRLFGGPPSGSTNNPRLLNWFISYHDNSGQKIDLIGYILNWVYVGYIESGMVCVLLVDLRKPIS